MNAKDIRTKYVLRAQGITSVEGRKPSTAALTISKRFINGEITAAQAKQIYLKSQKLAP